LPSIFVAKGGFPLKSRVNLDDDDYAENLSVDCLTIAAI